MDIIFIEQSPPRHRELSQEVSQLTHQRHFGEGNSVWLHGVNNARDLIGALRAALRDADLEDNFIISRDTTFITSPFDPSQAHYALSSLWLSRKGLETDAMVNTLRHLLESGFATFDYEIAVPHVFNKGLLLSCLEEMGDDPLKHVHTMYFNRHGFGAVPMQDPKMDVWVWNKVPPGPVVTLTDTCFSHPDCINWLKGLRENEPALHT